MKVITKAKRIKPVAYDDTHVYTAEEVPIPFSPPPCPVQAPLHPATVVGLGSHSTSIIAEPMPSHPNWPTTAWPTAAQSSPVPTVAPVPTPHVEVPKSEFVDVTVVQNKSGKDHTMTFTLNTNAFAGLVSESQIKDVFSTQSKIFLTTAIGEMLKTDEFKEIMLPKVKEHLLGMSLQEIMDNQEITFEGVLALFKD